ncbi:MAG: CoA-binding protein [Dehalococcoidales bacterium]|nr:CoA-binding protein [Dehalococcoidales bacterium]
MTHDFRELRPFFEPERVAVIGASRTPGKGGYNIIENLQKLGYGGAIYPVNPQAEEILGLPVYPDISRTPEVPDLALIIVPPAQVETSLKDCIGRGVKAVIIETAGFGETDGEGARREREIARFAGEAGVAVMGPNSVGTINTALPFDSSLGRLNELFLPKAELRRGKAGFIGQTGLFTGVYLPLINEEIGLSKAACLGNKCDVDESDMLAYFGEDADTAFIGMYLESIRYGRRFLDLSRRIIPQKPIVVIKSAVTESGARASVSHTGAIAGEDRIYDAAFRQAGIIRARGFEQLWDFARAFIHAPLPAGNRVGIINLAGSGCVTTVDACVRHGLRVADLSTATKDTIAAVYPDWWRVKSPVDVWAAIEASGFEQAYVTILRAVLADDGVDAVVVIGAAIDWLPGTDIPALFAGIARRFAGKPVFVVNPPGDRDIYLRLHRGFLAQGIPHYPDDEAAVASLSAMYRYRLASSRE